jgi:hypothetical protein
MAEFLAAPGPAVLQAVVDPYEPPYPAKVKLGQAMHFAESLARGEPNRKRSRSRPSDLDEQHAKPGTSTTSSKSMMIFVCRFLGRPSGESRQGRSGSRGILLRCLHFI